jgi:hypothetical protein
MHEYFISWFWPRYESVPSSQPSVTRIFGRCTPTHAHRTLFFRIAPPGKTNGILLYRKKSSNKKAVFPSNRYINKYMIHRVDRPTLMLIFAPSPLKIPLFFFFTVHPVNRMGTVVFYLTPSDCPPDLLFSWLNYRVASGGIDGMPHSLML